MGFGRVVGGLGRLGVVVGLGAVAAAHAVWASGSPWPAKNERQLAEAVTGDRTMPPAAASAAVAGVLGVTAVVAGSRRGGVVRTILRLGAAGVLGVRAALDADAATDVLGMRKPGRRFRELNERYYRPLCAALAAALVLSTFGTRPR